MTTRQKAQELADLIEADTQFVVDGITQNEKGIWEVAGWNLLHHSGHKSPFSLIDFEGYQEYRASLGLPSQEPAPVLPEEQP